MDKLSDILKNAKISDDGLQNLNSDFAMIYDLFCKFLPEKNYLEIQLVVFLKQIFFHSKNELENFKELVRSSEQEKKIRLDPELISLLIKKRKGLKLKADL